MQSLAQNHPFVDGNKRVSFALTAVFLRINGYKLTVSADAGESFMIEELIGKKISIEEIADWLEKHIHSV
ncbi:Toxin Doc [compost metagenome]